MERPAGGPEQALISIYERALGEDFKRLHPKIQERFGLTSQTGYALVGRGVMERLAHGPWWTYPLLYLGTFRRLLFPESGTDVPFTIQNYAYLDRFGRETVAWIRTFHTKRTRRFDAYMIFSEERGLVVDHVGTHQHIAVDIEFEVAENGGIRLKSGPQRLYEGPIAFAIPRIFWVEADVCEWWDEERRQFGIKVWVGNPRWGTLFDYNGYFDTERVSHDIPADVIPVREERRE